MVRNHDLLLPSSGHHDHRGFLHPMVVVAMVGIAAIICFAIFVRPGVRLDSPESSTAGTLHGTPIASVGSFPAIYEETFDHLPPGKTPIPGFKPREEAVGEVVHTICSSPPGCYMLPQGKCLDLSVKIGKRFIYEFDLLVSSKGSGHPNDIVLFGPWAGNQIAFRADDMQVLFYPDTSKPQVYQVGLWKVDQFTHVKVDLNFEALTGDIYLDGSLMVEKAPIIPNPPAVQGFQIMGHFAPHQAFIDNIRISQ